MSLTRFELGFPNEGWNDRLGCLVVPIPGTDKVVFVAPWQGKFTVHTQGRWHDADNILMATALVHNFINIYVTTGGNHEEQTHPAA